MPSTKITIGEVSYQIERMDALLQGKILKRLAPLIAKLKEATDSKLDPVESIALGISSLSDDDYDFIVLKTLSRVHSVVNGAPVKNALVEQGVLVNPNMDLDTVMQLVYQSLLYNFNDFFNKLPSSMSEDLQRRE